MTEQENLLQMIKKEFSPTPVIEVENKSDITKAKSDRLTISAASGAGVPKRIDILVGVLKAQQRL